MHLLDLEESVLADLGGTKAESAAATGVVLLPQEAINLGRSSLLAAALGPRSSSCVQPTAPQEQVP